MNVTLTPDLQKLIESEVRAGHFPSAGDFLKVAVQHYIIARDLGEAYSRAEVEAKIARGLAQIERGETVSGQRAFRQLRDHSRERRRQRA